MNIKFRNLFSLFSIVLSLLTSSTAPTSTMAFDLSPGVAVAGKAWSWYLGRLSAQPLLTKSLTSSGIMTVSDAMCQKLVSSVQQREKKPEEKEAFVLDNTRILQVAVTGFVWSGPITHIWYAILEKIVQIQEPILGLIARIFLDAIIFSPVTVSGYFTVRSILEGTGFKGSKEKLETRLVSTVIGAWKFWPAANIINFGLVPLQLRVLYVNVLSLFWTGYLSFVNAKKMNTTKK